MKTVNSLTRKKHIGTYVTPLNFIDHTDVLTDTVHRMIGTSTYHNHELSDSYHYHTEEVGA